MGRIKHLISIPQPETERILENYLIKFGANVKRGNKLVSWTQENGFYNTSLLDENGKEYASSYEYIIGADGASSTVRELADIGFYGHDYDIHFIMADVIFDKKEHLPGTSYHIDEQGFLIFVPMPDNVVRIVIKKDGRLPSPRPVPELMEINHYLSKYCNISGEACKLIWSSSANFFNRIADENNKEKVFLAGDAFHLFSPIGGQGMNTGIQDAVNLSWKLAFYLKGVGTSELLATYRSERFTAVNQVLKSTDHDTGLISGIVPRKSIDAVYYPEFCNRDYYRKVLPLKYSGFSTLQDSVSNSMAGQHVPYFSFTSDGFEFINTYDAFRTGKVIIFSARKDFAFTSIMKNDSHFLFCCLVSEDLNFLNLLHISHEEYAVLNPDGYIGFTGNEVELIKYLSSLYRLV
ncbi:FAD-dependent monooxygenase [Rouxiella badensis]|uniref:FAD-dependent monooxygenase n=1 Tax=Rouxiella badensis TaxID=1646377 RepID=UPI002AD4E98A|nr:FAD-dependent monooxygenase [Rouxiella badensis]